MFDRICIKPTEGTFPTDIGFIAENLLYYEQVIVIASTDTLPILLNNCDVEYLIELMRMGNLKILIKENLLGTMSQNMTDGRVINDVMLVSSESLTTEKIVFESVLNTTGRRGHSKRVSKRLLTRCAIEPKRA
jgi:hypothetical protein